MEFTDIDIANDPVEINIGGKHYKIDRMRQKHISATRQWMIDRRIERFVASSRFLQINAQGELGTALAKLAIDAPRVTELLRDPDGSMHLLAQAITIDDKPQTFASICDAMSFPEFAAVQEVWSSISLRQDKDAKENPTIASVQPTEA